MTVSTQPKLKTAKLIKLAEWVGAQHARKEVGLVSHWNQGHWFMKLDDQVAVKVGSCGTACCVAGKAALDAGWVPSAALAPASDDVWTPGDTDEFVVQVDKQGRPIGDAREVSEVAEELLGLTSYEAELLFEGDNEFDDVMRVMRQILSGETRQ